jgi:hypothetical protein
MERCRPNQSNLKQSRYSSPYWSRSAVRSRYPTLLDTRVQPFHLLPDPRYIAEREADYLLHLLADHVSYHLARLDTLLVGLIYCIAGHCVRGPPNKLVAAKGCIDRITTPSSTLLWLTDLRPVFTTITKTYPE